MKVVTFGKSLQGRDITGYVFLKKENLPVILVLGGVHGNEIEGVWLANHFKDIWQEEFPYLNIQVILVPKANPDGVAACTRVNAAGVDLNRNLPTKDWTPAAFNAKYPPGQHANSEPENKALVGLINECKPRGIITLHSFKDAQINANGDEETGVMDWANALLEVSPYKKITFGDGIGYPTPGCLGTYAGFERGIPTITYELLRGDSRDKILSENIPVVIRAMEFFENKF